MPQRTIIVLVWFIGQSYFGIIVAQTPGDDSATSPPRDQARETIGAREAIVVCPTNYRDSIQPWVELRESQGVTIRLVESERTAAKLVAAIRGSASERTTAVVLVGDAPAIGLPADANRQVPIHYTNTTVSARFGSTRELSTDLPYGDLDGDGNSDVPVGRLPVDNAEQLTELTARIRTYESSPDYSPWRGEVQLVGGVGGFGMLADSAIETVTRTIVTATLPNAVRTHIAYGSPGHRFYPRKRFREAVVEEYNKGCRFWVYAGHGHVEGLDRVPSGPTGVPVLDNQSLDALAVRPERSPIALLLCCYTGAIDASVDSFGERLLKHDGGPIAVIAGTRVTMPYGNCSFTLGMIESIYGNDTTPPAERLGDAWIWAMRRLEKRDAKEVSQMQVLVNAVAALISPAGTDLAEERREHTRLYTLLGDPLLKLRPPRELEIETASGFDFGQPIEVTVTSPFDGDCRITLDRAIGQVDPNAKRGDDPNATAMATEKRKVAANEPTLFRLTLPAHHKGSVLIRVHVAGKSDWASAASQTNVRPRPE